MFPQNLRISSCGGEVADERGELDYLLSRCRRLERYQGANSKFSLLLALRINAAGALVNRLYMLTHINCFMPTDPARQRIYEREKFILPHPTWTFVMLCLFLRTLSLNGLDLFGTVFRASE